MPEPRRIRPRHWEGLPGVTYPQEEAAPATPQDVPGQDWLSTQEAAALLRITRGGTLVKLTKLGLTSVKVEGTRYWPRAEVEALAGSRVNISELPPGWVTEPEARQIIGCGRSALYRLRAAGHLSIRRAILCGKSCILYPAEACSKLAPVLARRRELVSELRAWPTL